MSKDELDETRHRDVDGGDHDVGPSSASVDGTAAPSHTGGDAGGKSPAEQKVVVPLDWARGKSRAPQDDGPDDDDPGPAAA